MPHKLIIGRHLRCILNEDRFNRSMCLWEYLRQERSCREPYALAKDFVYISLYYACKCLLNSKHRRITTTMAFINSARLTMKSTLWAFKLPNFAKISLKAFMCFARSRKRIYDFRDWAQNDKWGVGGIWLVQN